MGGRPAFENGDGDMADPLMMLWQVLDTILGSRLLTNKCSSQALKYKELRPQLVEIVLETNSCDFCSDAHSRRLHDMKAHISELCQAVARLDCTPARASSVMGRGHPDSSDHHV